MKFVGVMVWVEVASPGAIQGAMTDGLVEVIGVSCGLPLSDGVSMGRPAGYPQTGRYLV